MAKPKAGDEPNSTEPEKAPEPTAAEQRAANIKEREKLLIAAGTPVAAAKLLAEQAEDNAALSAKLDAKGGK